MHTKSLLLLLALPLAACGAVDDPEAQIESVSAGLVSARKVPVDYVATPRGYYHKSCVHELDDGAEVDAAGRVTLPTGERTELPACAHPRLVLRASGATPAAAATTNGWVEDANWFSATPVTRMTSTFGVPKAPAASAGQTIFFFPGMEPHDGTIILQPVLQWGSSGAGGGSDWEIASWSCGPSCIHSKLVPVKSGDTLSGTITGSSCSATGQCSWKIVTTDSTSGKSTTLTTHGDTESYFWLFGGVLEAYSVSDCNEYPSSPTEVFSKVNFFDHSGNLLAPAFSADVLGAQPACSFHVAPSTHGVSLTY
jgi:hypothetical protein